ncbi:MAG: hypothetical protein ACXWDO_05390 [Bacteroidia bacterium]
MQQTKEFIVERLQEILANEASKHFNTTPLCADFKAYLVKITKVVDWDDEFIEEVYQIYLQKITATGQSLSNNMS